MSNRWLVVILASTLAGVGAHTASATPVAGLPAPTIEVNGTAIPLATLGCTNATGGSVLTCQGSGFVGTGFALDDWTFVLNPDPMITSTYTLTNISAITQTFKMNVTLPIGLIGPAIAISGSTGSGLLTDLNANGATLTDGGDAIYSASVNGSVLHTLLDPPQLYVAPADPFGGPSSVPIPPSSFGPIALNQTADVSMRIGWEFSLTSGDSLQLSGVFDLQPADVPEPGTQLLFGSGLAGLIVFRRRA